MTDDTKHTYYYDFANHLVAAVLKDTGDTVGQYRYDALGRRVRKVVDDVSDTLDGTTLFYYDGLRVIEEGQLDGQGAYTATHQYVWGFYLDELLVFDYDAQGDFDLADTSDQRGHSFQDFIYSTVAVMDPDGNVLERYDYEPYGAVTFWTPDYADTRAATAVHLDFLFTGQRYDPEAGLYHYKARVYDPTLGRFLQHDPTGFQDAMNMYEYGRSRAAYLSDPTGMAVTIAGALELDLQLFTWDKQKEAWNPKLRTPFTVYRFGDKAPEGGQTMSGPLVATTAGESEDFAYVLGSRVAGIKLVAGLAGNLSFTTTLAAPKADCVQATVTLSVAEWAIKSTNPKDRYYAREFKMWPPGLDTPQKRQSRYDKTEGSESVLPILYTGEDATNRDWQFVPTWAVTFTSHGAINMVSSIDTCQAGRTLKDLDTFSVAFQPIAKDYKEGTVTQNFDNKRKKYTEMWHVDAQQAQVSFGVGKIEGRIRCYAQ